MAGAYCLLLSGVLLRKRDVRDQGGEENGLQHCRMIYSNHRNIDKEFSKILFEIENVLLLLIMSNI